MAVTTANSLLEILEKSNLLTAEQFAEARKLADKNGDAKTLAKLLVQKELISRWQAGQLLAGRSSVFFLGKYKLIELLGRGGMGGVFLARHTMMNRPVALKIISKAIAKNPAALERFLAEARAIAALDDPNIVQAYNVDSEGGRYYIVMEYVVGQDLQRLVEAEGPLDYQRAADYIRQAADGLAHAHGRNMLHCDIKPSNLLVNAQGTVKILDMGMARLAKPGSEESADNGGTDEQVLGSVDYLAPEQAVQSPEMDHRADIYSLGCTLYYLLTGRPPFPEGTLHERILKHQTKEPVPITTLRPDAPKDLVAICRKMMAKKPADRVQSAAKVSQFLANWHPPKPSLMRAAPLDEAENEETQEMPGISISTDRPASKPAPAATRPAAARPAAKARIAGIVDTLKQLPRWVIPAAAGGVLLLILVIVLVVWALSGSSRETKHVAQTGTAAAKAKEKDIEDEEESPPKATVAEKPKPSAKPTQQPTEKPATETPKPEAKPEAKPETKPEAKPEAKPETKPETKPEPKPQPKPETKPETKPQPKPEPKPEPKPQPAPTPKDDNPFKALPALVDLPLLEQGAPPVAEPTDPIQLGTVDAPADTVWDLTLLGGDRALKGERQFVLQKDVADGKTSWIIRLETSTPNQNAAKTPVARFWRDGSALKFQWLKGAEASTANYLCNCLVEVYLTGKTHVVGLRKPAPVPAPVIDLAKGQVRAAVPLQWEPDAEHLRLEVTGFEGYKEFEIEPKGPAELKSQVVLWLTRKDQNNNVIKMVKLTVVGRMVRTGLNVEVRLAQPAAKVFRTKFPPALRDVVEAKRKELQTKLGQDKDNKIPPDERSKILQQIDDCSAQIWGLDLQKALEGGGMVQFRVIAEIGRNKVELVKTEAQPPPQPEAKQ